MRLFLLPLLAVSPAHAAVCEQPGDGTSLSIGLSRQHETTLGEGIGRTLRQNHDFELQLNLNETWAAGIAYRYVVLGLDPDALQTNGHLHTAFLPVHWRSGGGDQGFRLSLAPALSASSNIIKDPGEWSADAFQLFGAAVWRRALSEQKMLRYGLCADSRLGSYRVYPTLVLDWRPRADVRVELGFPVTRLSYGLTSALSMSLEIAPAGNEWHVRSADLARSSDLNLESTLLEWRLRWQAHDRVAITAGIGRLYHGRYEAVLPDDRRVRVSDEDVTRIAASLEWRF